MTLAETHPPPKSIAPVESVRVDSAWVLATWAEFIAIADDPAQAKAACYYFDHRMRIETMGVGPGHASDNSLIHAAIILYCALKGIPLKGLINASYRRVGHQEAQPDSSFYLNANVRVVFDGNTIINLDVYPPPDLAVEIAATLLGDDLGMKRMLYEELGVKEYWVVDVAKAQILAFQIVARGSQRITTSQVLPGLELAVLAAALSDRSTQDDSQIMATLMAKFAAIA